MHARQGSLTLSHIHQGCRLMTAWFEERKKDGRKERAASRRRNESRIRTQKIGSSPAAEPIGIFPAKRTQRFVCVCDGTAWPVRTLWQIIRKCHPRSIEGSWHANNKSLFRKSIGRVSVAVVEGDSRQTRKRCDWPSPAARATSCPSSSPLRRQVCDAKSTASRDGRSNYIGQALSSVIVAVASATRQSPKASWAGQFHFIPLLAGPSV